MNEMYEQHGETDLPKFIIVSSPNHNRDQEKFVLLPNKKAYIIKPMDKSKLEAAMDSIEN
ncbi:MAG: two-component SAPR family response regulator [Psychromonas sp.]|jgi:two-component SAPR family response regulator